MKVSVKFLGAAGCVTGSKYLVGYADKRILIDAGMFQGSKAIRNRNWCDPEVDLASIDAVILTHAHIDHVGILPRYVARGLQCPVYCSPPTGDLLHILLPDAAHIQEEEADSRNSNQMARRGTAEPLFTQADVKKTLPLLEPVGFNEVKEIFESVSFEFRRSGHIIGAANITLKIGTRTLNFSGDIGRQDVPILRNPEPVEFGDLLLIESTYGDRKHTEGNHKAELQEIINTTIARNGAIMIPSFAVGRTQTLLYLIRELKAEYKIPKDLPVIVDSPMASDATDIYRAHPEEYDPEAFEIRESGETVLTCPNMALVKEASNSRKLNTIFEPMIIISSSGMLYGGRIMHHLKNRLADPRNTLLFVGYQPPGSRGDKILSGARTVRIMGYDTQVNAEVRQISGFSGHADYEEMLLWCRQSNGKPQKVMVVHGEPESAEIFAGKLRNEMRWDDVSVATHLEEVEI